MITNLCIFKVNEIFENRRDLSSLITKNVIKRTENILFFFFQITNSLDILFDIRVIRETHLISLESNPVSKYL